MKRKDKVLLILMILLYAITMFLYVCMKEKALIYFIVLCIAQIIVRFLLILKKVLHKETFSSWQKLGVTLYVIFLFAFLLSIIYEYYNAGLMAIIFILSGNLIDEVIPNKKKEVKL